MNCSPLGCFVRGDTLGKNTGVGCYTLLQGIFPTQGLKPRLPHCRQMLYCLSQQESPSLLQGIFSTQKSNQSLLHCRQSLYQLSYKGSHMVMFKIGASQVALVVKNLTVNAGDLRYMDPISELRRSPGGGHGNPLQYSCPENPMDRGAWQATVHGVAKSYTTEVT